MRACVLVCVVCRCVCQCVGVGWGWCGGGGVGGGGGGEGGGVVRGDVYIKLVTYLNINYYDNCFLLALTQNLFSNDVEFYIVSRLVD